MKLTKSALAIAFISCCFARCAEAGDPPLPGIMLGEPASSNTPAPDKTLAPQAAPAPTAAPASAPTQAPAASTPAPTPGTNPQVDEKPVSVEDARVQIARLNQDFVTAFNSNNMLMAEMAVKMEVDYAEKHLPADDLYVAASLRNMGFLDTRKGKLAEAETFYERALTIRRKGLKPDDPILATTMTELAEVYGKQGKYTQSIPLYRSGLDINTKMLSADSPALANNLTNLGIAYMHDKQDAQAEPYLVRAKDIQEKGLGDPTDIGYTLNALGLIHSRQGHSQEAEQDYLRALEALNKASKQDQQEIAICNANLGVLSFGLAKYPQAEIYIKRALDIRQSMPGGEPVATAAMLQYLGIIYIKENAYARAEPILKKALDMSEKLYGSNGKQVGDISFRLGLIYVMEGKTTPAEPLLRHALSVWDLGGQTDKDMTIGCLQGLVNIYNGSGRIVEASNMQKRLLQVQLSK